MPERWTARIEPSAGREPGVGAGRLAVPSEYAEGLPANAPPQMQQTQVAPAPTVSPAPPAGIFICARPRRPRSLGCESAPRFQRGVFANITHCPAPPRGYLFGATFSPMVLTYFPTLPVLIRAGMNTSVSPGRRLHEGQAPGERSRLADPRRHCGNTA
jgi:hypothetical protein